MLPIGNIAAERCNVQPLRHLSVTPPLVGEALAVRKAHGLNSPVGFVTRTKVFLLLHEAAHSPLLCSALMRKQSKAEAKLLIKRRERLPFDQVIALGICTQIS